MDISRVEMIDQSKTSHIEKVQKVPKSDQSDKVDPDEQYKNAKQNEIIQDTNEVILDNVKFGYNQQTNDFFVKVIKEDIEYMYPTEIMMKMKAHLLQLMEEKQ